MSVGDLKKFMEQKDDITPQGGRKVMMPEMKELDKKDRDELSELAAAALAKQKD